MESDAHPFNAYLNSSTMRSSSSASMTMFLFLSIQIIGPGARRQQALGVVQVKCRFGQRYAHHAVTLGLHVQLFAILIDPQHQLRAFPQGFRVDCAGAQQDPGDLCITPSPHRSHWRIMSGYVHSTEAIPACKQKSKKPPSTPSWRRFNCRG